MTVGPPLLEEVRWTADGLVAAIAQDATSGEVLMMAWMNRESLTQTLATGRAVYWSRSRQQLWRKGDSSGHIQHVRALWLDCDGDTVLMRVDQIGAACHTGARTCFYRRARIDCTLETVAAAQDLQQRGPVD